MIFIEWLGIGTGNTILDRHQYKDVMMVQQYHQIIGIFDNHRSLFSTAAIYAIDLINIVIWGVEEGLNGKIEKTSTF